jgi:hypothetical protein
MAVLCTNWMSTDILDKNTTNFFTGNEAAYWIKIVS